MVDVTAQERRLQEALSLRQHEAKALRAENERLREDTVRQIAEMLRQRGWGRMPAEVVEDFAREKGWIE